MIVFGVDLGGEFVGHGRFRAERGREPTLLDVGTWRIYEPARVQSPGVRWLRLRGELANSLAYGERPDLVVYEEVRSHTSRPKGSARPVFNVSAAHVYGGAQAELLAWCAAERLEVTSVQVQAIKMAAVGRGGGEGTKKPQILAAARRRWPAIHFPDDNAADAAFAGLAALIGLGLAVPTPRAPVSAAPTAGETPSLFGNSDSEAKA